MGAERGTVVSGRGGAVSGARQRAQAVWPPPAGTCTAEAHWSQGRTRAVGADMTGTA
jgi:hypothetical protein